MTVSQSPIGFEGFEKRLEISFSPAPIFSAPEGLGLRALTRAQLDVILEPACCSIVAQLSNDDFDSYVLSESSLFVYPSRVILKTCGTTKLLLSIPPILRLAESLGLGVSSVSYSRGSFIFPELQPSPHRSFTEEVAVLNEYFGHLRAAAYVIGDPNRTWHVYSASKEKKEVRASPFDCDRTGGVTVEICMTGLERDKAAVFFKTSGDYSARDMTKLSGIFDVMPGHVICDFDFDPCGYSMNGIEGRSYSTVHVTPEDGFSYASYEAKGFDTTRVGLDTLVGLVARCFGPSEFSVAITCGSGGLRWARESDHVEGYRCQSVVRQELQGGEWVVYKTYELLSRGCVVPTPVALAVAKHCREEEEDREAAADEFRVAMLRVSVN
ncbi:hypothetical protein CDL15_Pgr015284 [Punica granatum]|nr:hypothetical protein CDL15_Pgr015284 [Punica granatum]